MLDERGLIERHPDPDAGAPTGVAECGRPREFVDDSRHAGEEWLARALHERFTEAEHHAVIEAMALLERLTHP